MYFNRWKHLLSFLFLFSFSAQAAPNSFQELNGVMWFYNSRHSYKFAQIEADLDRLHASGIRIIGIYSPYHGDKWYGCGAVDFYSTAPQSGTMSDWLSLVSAAHKHGMKVVSYFANIYIDKNSTFFKKAIQQYKTGDRSSREVSAFHWTTDPKKPLPTPAMTTPNSELNRWVKIPEINAYYWQLWGEAGFDFNLPGAKAEVERFTKFWLDTGLDGFMWDATFVDPRFKPLLVDLPLTYTSNDKWITFESTAGEEAASYAKFGITSWFNHEDDDGANNYSLIANGKATADELEKALQVNDFARSQGRMTHAWSLWGESKNRGNTYPSEELMRVQEAALLAGAGITYGSPAYEQYMAWPEALRSKWSKVLATVNANKALLPAASRERVRVLGGNKKLFAMKRESEDRKQTVLLVYNFSNRSASVKLDLRRTGITPGTPADLYSGESAPAITGDTYELSLPAYGFRFLQVSQEE